MHFGEEIRTLRKSVNLTQVEFARRADIGLRFVRELENGKSTVQLNKVLAVLNFFGRSLEIVKATTPLVFNDKYRYPKIFTKELKEKIREKFHFTCFECQKKQRNKTEKFDIHHIDYDKENCKEENLIFLCGSCHGRTSKNRNYWQEHFKRMLKFYTE